jgi:tetratricopeptide (TPR) repeat protein
VSPYIARIIRIAGACLLPGSGAVKIFEMIINKQPIPTCVYWLVAASAAAIYWMFYLIERGAVEDLVGIYVPVKQLKNPRETLCDALRLSKYHSFYGRRSEDDQIQQSLKDNDGCLIVGRPLSGKTRAAIEAIVAVKPNAYLMSFSSPGKLSQETIDKLTIPSLFIWWRKPQLVLFFDDFDKFIGKPFQPLLTRLDKQVTSVTVVATCRVLDVRKIWSDPETETLRKGKLSRRVDLKPLDQRLGNEIFREVWKGKIAPLVIDRTLPGAIVLGLEQMRNTYRELTEDSKRLITALGLAVRCGASPCEPAFLWMIFERVLKRTATGRDAILSELEEKDFVFVHPRRGISIQHDSYLAEDYMDYYSSIVGLKRDLNELETLLTETHNSERLMWLGLYHQNEFQDLPAARKAFETGVALNPSEARYYRVLACLYARIGESDRAAETINKCRILLKDRNEQATSIALFADELLYKLNRILDSSKYYAEAYGLATDVKTRDQIALHYADCLMKNREFARAEPLYCEWYKRADRDDKVVAGSRFLLAVASQGKWEEVCSLLRELWKGSDCNAKIQTVIGIFDNAEGCFAAGDPQLYKAYEIVWGEFRSLTQATRSPKDRVEDLIAFAGSMFNGGFLEPALLAYDYLAKYGSNLVGLEPKYHMAVLNNLGATFYDMRKIVEAREVFERLTSLTKASPQLDLYAGYALVGIADCDLFEGKDSSVAKDRYQKALAIGENLKDENLIFWAHLGLGDIYLQKGDYPSAEKEYKALSWIPISYSGETRFALGLAQTYLGMTPKKLDDAEAFAIRGLLLPLRHSYSYRLDQLRSVRERINQERALSSTQGRPAFS